MGRYLSLNEIANHAESVGFEASDVFNVIHPIGKGVLSIFSPNAAQAVEDLEVDNGLVTNTAKGQEKIKAQQAAAASADRVRAAIDADARAASALTLAMVTTDTAKSAPPGQKAAADRKAQADQLAANIALMDVDQYASTVAAHPDRMKAATDRYAAAVKVWQTKPESVVAKSGPIAWQTVMSHFAPAAPAPGATGSPGARGEARITAVKKSGGGFLTRKNEIFGVENWKVGLGAAGGVALIITLVEVLSKKPVPHGSYYTRR